ncbi:MAG: dipeptide epimerase [Ferruginibacter sp.]
MMKKKLQVNYRTINLPFTHPFTISKGTKTHQPALVVELDFFGVKGYGEAPAITYYHIPVEKMIADLEAKRPWIESYSFNDPERFWHYLHHLIPENNFLICALDMAGWDLYGKLKKMPLYQLWALDPAHAPLTDFTIGIDDAEVMVKKMKEKPWPIYKIKMGGKGDVELLENLRKHTDAIFRVDVNGGWSAEEARKKIPLLAGLGVQLVEQPLAKDDWDGMKNLFELSGLPLIADEACVKEEDVLKCAGYFHGINIKLTKCGGITPALRMIKKARELNLQVMLGCMNESSIGTAALAHLAPLADFLDMDGPLLLSEDAASGPSMKDGVYAYNQEPGLGINTNLFKTT